MARASYTKTTKRQKKIPDGMQKCNVCGGKGYHKKAKKKS